MKVAYFAATMIKDQDGVARVIYHWIDYLKKNKIKNMFITGLNQKIKEENLYVHQVPSVKFHQGKDKIPIAIPGQVFFYKRVHRFRPDIIHVNSPCSLGFAAINYAKWNHIPVVATYHTHFPHYLKYWHVENFESMGWLYLKRFYNQCDEVYVPEKTIMEELKSHGFKRLKLLPHGIDNKIFNKKFRSQKWRKEQGIGDKVVVMYVGRLIWEKDINDLAKIYSYLKKDKRMAFVIVGDGSARKELEAMMPTAKFIGKLTGKALSTAYASGDIFVSPSTTETFGNVTIEAMASGLACVCANSGGPKGIIQDGITGFLAKPHDIKDFVNKISYLISHPKQRIEIAKKGFEYASTQTWDKICDELFKNYAEVIENYKKKKHKWKRLNRAKEFFNPFFQ